MKEYLLCDNTTQLQYIDLMLELICYGWSLDRQKLLVTFVTLIVQGNY